MKKFILIITLILTLFSFNYEVKADTIVDFTQQDFTKAVSYGTKYGDFYIYNNFEKFISDNKNKNIFDYLYNDVLNLYNKDYFSDYPYYIMSVQIFSNSSTELDLECIVVKLYIYDNPSANIQSNHFETIMSAYYDGTYFNAYYGSQDNFPVSGADKSFYETSNVWYYYPTFTFESNFDYSISPYFTVSSGTTFNIYSSDSLLVSYHEGDKVPVYFENGYDSVVESKYTTINLNDYAYIALFLKDYSNTKAFSSTTYVKGQSCVTPVYNFSTSLKPNKSENICTPVYEDYTISDIFILESDIKNNAVYYVSAYNKDIENSIKIDNTVFDIFYVSEEDAKNPTFNYNGKEYNGIALDDIDYSANNNTENGVVPGESQNFGDFADDVISKPIDFFKSIASAITSFFGLITSFLSFLPIELQSFLYFAFVIAIVLGILKILL